MRKSKFLLFSVVYLSILILFGNGEEQRDYHQVIDQLAKALSNKAQSMRNVTQILDKVIDKPTQKYNISSSNWRQFSNTSTESYSLPYAPYRPSAIENLKNVLNVTAPPTSLPQQRVTVPSQRLLNDILVVRSSRRLYILALVSIHESLNGRGYECGPIDVNSMVHLGSMLSALDEINEKILEPDLNLGMIVVDTCSADLRTLANLYELFTGTNIQRNDIVAVIHDDNAHFPITDKYLSHLELPIVKTFFPRKREPLVSSVLPYITEPIEAIMDLLKHTKSTCVSVIHDEAYTDFVSDLSNLAFERYMCIDRVLNVSSVAGVAAQQKVIRQLLLSEARVVLVMYTERSWLDFIEALNEEMVISGRFIFATVKSERWATSRLFSDIWPKFDQLLFSVAYKPHRNISYYNKLNADFPQLPFPVQWLRQFWTTAFKCHFSGDQNYGEQFSRICPTQQKLDLSSISPAFNVAPSSLAVHSIGHALRTLVERNCPGALVKTLTDCLNEPYTPLNLLVRSVSFVHPLTKSPSTFSMSSGNGFGKAELVLTKLVFNKDQLVDEELGIWDSEGGLTYTANSNLFVEDRDGTRVQVVSQCPKSSCWGSSAIKRTAKHLPKLMDSVLNTNTLVFSCVAVVLMFICLMCTYQKMVSSVSDPFWVCSSLSFVGCAMTSVASILFITQPSEPICALRLGLYSVCLISVVVPITVRVIGSYNYHTVSLKGNIVSNNRGFSGVTQFWSAVMLIISQCLLIAQWSAFDDIRALAFSQFEAQFSWRCMGGEQSEYVMIRSCAFVGLMTILTVMAAIFRCSAKDFHAVILSFNVWSINAAIWYFAPEFNFQFRDLGIGILMLYFAVSTLISSYCFSPKYPVMELYSATLSSTLMDDNKRGTLRRKTQFIEQEQEYRTLGRSYATMQQPRTIPRSTSANINAATT
ncbi:unnamed protein product [Bursaphelenchus okinawaensis]|uniref:Receptor ligand binding region domain-containing protein n=1 Tax=Bursaphelenchus okinawaensis TaxID=465554 RepID=A0A811KEA8_9BILA|nr:unnamed protein product [Bursaphelenchus okinawaensis]CAG9101635.1 unnamed protein product [Bursaphelenchus okinawaensis]